MNDFYLCHPDAGKSCAACCGIYNYEGFDRDAVRAALEFRTQLFRAMKPVGEGLDEFRSIVDETDVRPKLLEDIYCCEFSGFVDDSRRRAGCLIHPQVCGGKDERDRAFYGAQTCAAHRCGSYSHFSSADAAPIIAALDDWYLYGICLADVEFIKEFYRLVSDLRGSQINPEKIARNDKALEIFRRYLTLKEDFPFKRGRRRFGQYIIENGNYRVADIDWAKLGCKRPKEWKILRSLSAEFKDCKEVIEAVKIVGHLTHLLAEALD